MLVDAGYSGDWSRIGAISKELETELKGIAPLVGGFHLFCAPIAAITASKRGLDTPRAVAKVCHYPAFASLLDFVYCSF